MSRAFASVNLNSHWKKGVVLLLVLVASFLLLLPHRASAQSLTTDLQVTDSLLEYCTSGAGSTNVTNLMMCGASLIISLILEIFVWFLGLMILLVINVLMGFIVYNDFGSAPIVQTGWVIIRDLTNMFFIVILLISAFATIVGYDAASFHYKKVLPKLLLMAILVNFSKTIILVLVDFSQVVMLTFVNAFQQSASGNFVNGLGLNSVLRLPGTDTAGAGGTPPTVSMFNIVLALALSVVLLSIMLSTMIILTMFIMVRIIGIWIILIFSPAAFLATALPDRLKKGMTSITTEYWGKLANLLSGGPVIAFFLWLTLSSVQGAGSAGGGLAPALNLGNQEAVAWLFPTSAGNSNAIASFIVGITLMLMGVGVAVQAAQQASSTFGSIAGKIAGAGTKYGGKLALAGLAAPAYGLYAGARGIDRRADLTGRASRAALRVPVLRSVARRPLLAGATMRRREAAEARRSEDEYLKHLSGSEQASIVGAYGKGALSSLGERGQAQNILSMVTSEKGQKEREKAMTGELLKTKKFKKIKDPEEAKRLAGMEAKENIRQGSSALLKQGLDMAQKSGNFDEIEKYQKQLEQSPQLSEDIEKQMDKMRADPEKLNAMSKEAKQSFSVALNALPTGTMNVDKDGVVQGFDQPSLERFYEQNAGNKELIETVKLAVDHVQKSDGAGVSKEELMGMQKQRTADGKVKLYGKAFDSKGASTGYEPKFNQQYTKRRAEVERNFSGGGGITPSGDLTTITGNNVNSAIGSGVQVSDIMAMTQNAGQKNAIVSHFGSVSEGASRSASAATTKKDLDTALSDAVNEWQQLEKMDAGAQVKILSHVNAGGGAQMIAQKWDLADNTQRQAMQKLVKQAALRAAEISRKRSSGATITVEEEQVEQLVTQLKQEMPRTKTGSTRAAPAAIRQVLHEGEK